MHTKKITAASFLTLLAFPCFANDLLADLVSKRTAVEKSLPALGEESPLRKSRSMELKQQLKEFKANAKNEIREVGKAVEYFVFQGSFQTSEFDLTMQSVKDYMTFEYSVAGIEAKSVFNPVKGSIKTKLGDNLMVNIKNISSNPEVKLQYSTTW